MTRIVRPAGAALAVAAGLIFGTLAGAQVLGAGAEVIRQTVRPRFPAVPGFYMLRMADVQKELELSEEQKKKLQEISNTYYEDVRQDWSGIAKLSAEERKAKIAEIRQKNKKRSETLRKEIENVLFPKQLDRLRMIRLRSRAPYLLQNPRTLQQLEVTDKQKKELRTLQEEYRARLRKIQQEYQEKTRQLQKQSLEKSLEVLNPKQREQLEELGEKGYQARYGAQATPQE